MLISFDRMTGQKKHKCVTSFKPAQKVCLLRQDLGPGRTWYWADLLQAFIHARAFEMGLVPVQALSTLEQHFGANSS